MAGSAGSWRPTRPSTQMVATVVVVGIVLIAVSVASPLLLPSPTASPSPGGSTAPAPSPSAEPTTGPVWESVELLPLAPVAELQASLADAAGIAPDATFALTSLTSETATTMAERIEVSPPIELDVAAGPDDRSTTLTPSSDLRPGTQYRFALRAPDGTLAASWAFRVRSPVRVLSTIPGDRTTEVPVRTGIEVTFDQDSVADMADHFTIEPAVTGRFERHGRTQVFIPDRLSRATLYTVTVGAGLARTGTDLALEQDQVFRFETEGEGDRTPWLRFARDTIETSPAEATVFGVEMLDPDPDPDQDPDAPPPPELAKADVRVYRIPSQAAAVSTLRRFLAAPRWTNHSVPLMPTEGLAPVASFTATVERLAQENAGVIRFPEPLPKGFYIAEIQGARPSQAFLQVTPVSAWVSVLSDRTVVWVNDTATGRPIAGATAEVSDGPQIGRSDTDGLAIGPTPAALIPPAEARDEAVPDRPSPLVVRSPSGDVVLVPFEVGWNGGIYRGEWWEKTESADPTYWSLLMTERGIYRQTDTIGAWGYLRGRDDGSVPPSVELRLVRTDAANDDSQPPVVRVDATPDAVGAFAASVPLARVPVGYYYVQAVVDGRVVASTWVRVDVIRKPAYRFELQPDQLAVLTGTEVAWAATATFFDGTRVPDLPVAFSMHENSEARMTTDTAGMAVQRVPVLAASREPEDWDYWDTEAQTWYASVMPATQEESEIWATSRVLVFPSSRHLDLEGKLDGSTLRITGAVDQIDLAKIRAALAASTWDEDPDGKPVAGATVKVTVTELIPVRRQVGTAYDFIEKVARPLYEYDTRREVVKTFSVKSGADGRISASVTVPDREHEYEITASTDDPDGRAARKRINVGPPFDAWWFDAGVRFQTPEGEAVGEDRYGIGEPVRWRITDDGSPIEPGDRFLYIVAQRGLRAATVSTSPTFEREFSAADAPRIFVMGVRFTGTTYAPKAAAWADFDASERELAVAVTSDRDRYRPGEDVVLAITTRDADGRPVAATVAVQAVDEKLFAMGEAAVPEPLDALYAPVDSGIVRLTSTHQVPVDAGPEGEGGDTTGGGPRDEFRDTLAVRLVSTDASGRATTTIRLSDDLTAWHVSAAALTAALQAGVDDLLIPVGLPLFADVTLADSYLLSDRPSIRLRAYGDDLEVGDPVVFTVASRTLGLAETRLEAAAFEDVDLALPTLKAGRQSLVVSVTAPTRLDRAGKPLTDSLVRTFDVVRSRLTTARTEYLVLGDALPAVAGEEIATYTFTDAARGRFLAILETLPGTSSLRVDRVIAGSMARTLLIDAYGRDPATLPPDSWDRGDYELGAWQDENGVAHMGLALLPYGDMDPWVAARVAVLAPEALDQQSLRDTLLAIRDADSTRRDLWIAAVAGLAVAGEPVGEDLDVARAAPDLSVTEQVYLALGYAALGDDASALAIERELLERRGEQLGPWVRLKGDPNGDETALLAVVAARIGDPMAIPMIDYVRSQPSDETTHDLELAAASRAALERTPATRASFAYTIGGKRTVVRLEPGESVALALTAGQRVGLGLERISGSVGVAIAWREPTDGSSLPRGEAVRMVRTLPGRPVPVDHLLTVDIRVFFRDGAPRAHCYEVVEEVPSGLAPLASWDVGGANVFGPTSVVGQRVTFCIPNPVGLAGTEGTLRYRARVVGEGTFTWEPAVLQLEGAADVGTSVDGGTVTIGTP